MALGAVCCVRACVCTYIVHECMYVGCCSRGVHLESARMLSAWHSVSSHTELLHAATERYNDRCDGLGDIKYDLVLVVFAW